MQIPANMISLGDDESPMSSCSRVALLVGRTARDFCLDMGFTFQAVVDGIQPALKALAFHGRLDADSLAAAAVVKVGERSYTIGNQLLVRETLSRKSLRICPHCVLESLESGAGPRDVRPYGRTSWLIAPIRTCFTHGLGLVVVSADEHPHRVHDFARLLKPNLARMEEVGRGALRRQISPLERHLMDRREGRMQGAPWLQSLPFYAAARACEMLGAVASHDVRFRAESLTDADWHEAGAVGFEIAAHGEEGIRNLLSRLQTRFNAGRQNWGPRQVFGRLYEWLAHESEDPVYEPLREIIRRHVIDTMPIGPGEEIFGAEVTTRRVHSLQSASLEFGAHPKRLRKLLHAAGYISQEAMGLTNERILFDAVEVCGFMERVSEAMSLSKAGEYLNAPRPHERLLFEAGFIQPFIPGGTDIIRDHAFAKRDLDAFLERLFANAHEAGEDEASLLPIPAAAKRACCSAMEIVGLILEGRLTRVRRRPDVPGYLSVLVDPEEVMPLVRRPDDDGVSLRQVERELKSSTQVVTALIQRGHLPSRTRINPVNRCPQQVVSRSDLDAFMVRYVSLHVAAGEKGIHFRKLNSMLGAAGAEPAFDPAAVHATFYERTSVVSLST